jgi:uncharacterized protein YaaQ
MSCGREIGSRSNDDIKKEVFRSSQVPSRRGFYRGGNSTLLRGIHVDPSYTIDKVLGIFLKSDHFEVWELVLAP